MKRFNLGGGSAGCADLSPIFVPRPSRSPETTYGREAPVNEKVLLVSWNRSSHPRYARQRSSSAGSQRASHSAQAGISTSLSAFTLASLGRYGLAAVRLQRKEEFDGFPVQT